MHIVRSDIERYENELWKFYNEKSDGIPQSNVTDVSVSIPVSKTDFIFAYERRIQDES